MTDVIQDRPPKLIRPDAAITAPERLGMGKEELWELFREASDNKRKVNDERVLRELAGIKGDDQERLAAARKFENTLHHIEEYRRAENRIKTEKDPRGSDPGGEKVGVREKDGKVETIKTGKVWELLTGVWNDNTVDNVYRHMGEVFTGNYLLKKDQKQVVLELLMANEYSPEQVAQSINPQDLQTAREKVIEEFKGRNATPEDINNYTLLRFFTDTLKLKDDNVKRFVLYDRLRDSMDRDDFTRQPGSVEELAWQMSWKKEEKWGLHGEFPLLELRQVKNPRTGKNETNYFLNKANFRLWVRERAFDLLDVSPYSTPNFDQEIKLDKGGIYDIPLERFYHNRDSYLKSQYDWLFTQEELVRDLQIDSVLMSFTRQAWVAFDKAKADPKETMKVLTSIHDMNLVTRKSFGTDLISMLVRLPLRDTGVDFKNEHVITDNVVGSAFLDMLLAYEAISDYDRLVEVLGENSTFFTRLGMLEGAKQRHKGATGHSGIIDAYNFLRDTNAHLFEKAFYSVKELTGMSDEDFFRLEAVDQKRLMDEGRTRIRRNSGDKGVGDIKDTKAFIKLMNIFFEEREDPNKVEMVRWALKQAMIDKHDGFKTDTGATDEVSAWMAELMAFACTNWTGIAAYHDRRGIGWSAAAQLQMTGMYRLDKVNEKGGTGTGNPRTIFTFPQLMVPFFQGVESSGKTYVRDVTTGEIIGERRKSIQESFHDLQRLRTKQLNYLKFRKQQLTEQGKSEDDITRELAEEKKGLDNVYLRQAGDLRFDESAARAYTVDHVQNLLEKILPMIKGAQELDLKNFTEYDPYTREPRFDMQKYQEEVISKLVAPVRQAYSKHKDLNYNMMVRVPRIVPLRDKGGNIVRGRWDTKWETVPLAKALFGYELLNCEPYWKKGKGGYEYDKDGKHIIDYNKVNERKVYVWKRWIMMKLAADIQQDRLRDTPIGAFKPNVYYESVFRAIESIPGMVMGDEFRMSGVSVPEGLYSKEEMKEFRQKALETRLLGKHFPRTLYYLGWILRDLQAKDDEEGWGFGLLLSQVIKGIGFTRQGWLN